MLGFDSLDALRASITARVGLNPSATGVRSDLSPVIGRLLLHEARESERHIASIRLSLAALYLMVGLVVRVSGNGISSTALLAQFAWTGVSGILFLALRNGWYRNWVRKAAPTADAGVLVTGAILATQHGANASVHSAVLGNSALLCAFLVFTGALRLTRLSALYSSTAAVVAFIIIGAQLHADIFATSSIIGGLIATSLLAGHVTDVIRRVVATEVSRLEMERQVERTNTRLAAAQAASEAREDVLHIVAHDLRNPLGTLLMCADLLTDPTLGAEARAQQTGVIKRTGARMNRLIRDLLDLARIDTGKLAVDPRRTTASQLITNAVELMKPLASERSLTLETDVPASLPELDADAERVNQVFSNLIGNAIKFTPEGGRIVLSAAASDGYVWFTITDTGPGIPPEHLSRIFGPFWQARKTDTRGIGLGLTIAQGIVEAHKGKIGVSSDVGVGTKFWFGLPSNTSRDT